MLATTARKQRDEIRRLYPGVVLILRIGDLYAAYEEDAATLTQHARELVTVEPQRVTVDEYDLAAVVTALVDAGCRVAVCEESQK